MQTTERPSGLIGTLRELGDGFLGSVHDRIELIAIELQEEKLRLIHLYVWISALVFSGLMALTFATLALVFAFWENAKLAVLGGFAVFYGAVFIAAIIGFRRYLARQSPPLAATLEELNRDRTCIRGEN